MKFLPGLVVATTIGSFNSLAWSINYGWWGVAWSLVIAAPIGAGTHAILCIWPAVREDEKS